MPNVSNPQNPDVSNRFAPVQVRWLMVLCLSAVLITPSSSTGLSSKSLITGVPHIMQKPDFCGEACVAMWLQKLGTGGDQDWVFDQSGLDPMKGRGVYTGELVPAARNIGFNTGQVWYRVDASTTQAAAVQLSVLFGALCDDLSSGIPSIVCMRWDDGPQPVEHFRLVLGWDPSADEIIFNDPAVTDGAYQHMKRDKFVQFWPLKYERNAWTVVRLRLEGGRLQKGISFDHPTGADFAQTIMELKKTLSNTGFSSAISPPFVVVGNLPDLELNRWASGTVKWTADHLKTLYFSRELDHVITIYLFADDKSYRKYAKEILGDEPDTPYGYYSPRHEALVMNIGTGGGTLVHEIVHPYMRANFPECPDWFNEGMGSLYEQSSERNGQIIGLTNWRLAGLQRAIRAGTLPSFEALLSNKDFYSADPGTNYAQARYLCYYLQENSLLPTYYRTFHANHKADPTGWETLKTVLHEKDMTQFQKRWEQWVLGLKFP